MKREIKFRGFSINSKKFVYGYYYEECGNTYILEDRQKESELNRNQFYKIDKNTLGQFTGLKDKEGSEIYEGDVLQLPPNIYIEEGKHQVIYYTDGFVTVNLMFRDLDTANKNSLNWMIKRGAIVVGTIYDKIFSRS